MEIWVQDEARVGQQGTLTRIWARRGTRPRAPRDTRYKWSYIFGAACPARGSAAGLILPYVDAGAMGLHLSEIAKAVAPGSHALLILDGAGWHGAKGLRVPDNITLLKLPPYAPELNPPLAHVNMRCRAAIAKRLGLSSLKQIGHHRVRHLRRDPGKVRSRLELFCQ